MESFLGRVRDWRVLRSVGNHRDIANNKRHVKNNPLTHFHGLPIAQGDLGGLLTLPHHPRLPLQLLPRFIERIRQVTNTPRRMQPAQMNIYGLRQQTLQGLDPRHEVAGAEVDRVDFGDVQCDDLVRDGVVARGGADLDPADRGRFAGRLHDEDVADLAVAGAEAAGDRERVRDAASEDVGDLEAEGGFEGEEGPDEGVGLATFSPFKPLQGLDFFADIGEGILTPRFGRRRAPAFDLSYRYPADWRLQPVLRVAVSRCIEDGEVGRFSAKVMLGDINCNASFALLGACLFCSSQQDIDICRSREKHTDQYLSGLRLQYPVADAPSVYSSRDQRGRSQRKQPHSFDWLHLPPRVWQGQRASAVRSSFLIHPQLTAACLYWEYLLRYLVGVELVSFCCALLIHAFAVALGFEHDIIRAWAFEWIFRVFRIAQHIFEGHLRTMDAIRGARGGGVGSLGGGVGSRFFLIGYFFGSGLGSGVSFSLAASLGLLRRSSELRALPSCVALPLILRASLSLRVVWVTALQVEKVQDSLGSQKAHRSTVFPSSSANIGMKERWHSPAFSALFSAA
ncbi:hypothetical protein KC340_g150 [Hortaea werneckii]|nr:hypothetical protein KC340_g150 [Hortaea werneckii]